jgi:hypothetical protein
MKRDHKGLPEPERSSSDGKGRNIWELVLEDMKARHHMGVEKYKKALKAFDSRDSLVDAYQEALDLSVYIRKKIKEEELRKIEARRLLEFSLRMETCDNCNAVFLHQLRVFLEEQL